MTSDSSILHRIWNHLNGMQRMACAIATLCAFLVGGALYWEEDYEKQFARWKSTQAETVASTFTTAPAWMGLLGLTPAYHGTATLRFNTGEREIITKVHFVYHSLFPSDADRVLRRFMPGGKVNIRFNPQEADQVHVNSTFPTATSRFIYAAGFLLALLAGILWVVGELLEAVSKFRK
jgi:hypothetical protein